MGKNIYLVFVAGFFALCLSVVGAVWWSVNELRAFREEYDLLEQERASSERMMQNMQHKNVDLTQVTGLNIDNAGLAHDAVEFYSAVREALENNNVELLSMNSEANSENILSLHLQGNYYSVARAFAQWRTMPFAARINSLKIKRDTTSPTNRIDAEVVLEAMMEGK
ncbi:MAG: hypothetical protein IJT02_05515 [Synergistaceae bacterium]|nr:hypothetical protein [Synergistaceae bacterium]